MNNYVTGSTIKSLRETKKITQKQLADILSVSDKAVSKWETGKGLPDIALLEPLALALGVSVAELLSGECVINGNRSANILKSKFYVCPVCGNIINATGEGAFSCCGITLPLLEPEPFEDNMTIEKMDNDWYIALEHPMTKEHYISFMAYVTSNKVQIIKLYPEQNAEARFTRCGHGMVYVYCNKNGLFAKRI